MRKMRADLETTRQSAASVYGASFEVLTKSATSIQVRWQSLSQSAAPGDVLSTGFFFGIAPGCALQANFRGHRTRQNVAKMRASKEEADKKLADVKARRVWLKKHQGAAEADGGEHG